MTSKGKIIVTGDRKTGTIQKAASRDGIQLEGSHKDTIEDSETRDELRKKLDGFGFVEWEFPTSVPMSKN